MKNFDVKLPVTLTVRARANSAAEVRFYLHKAFAATRANDPLEGVAFSSESDHVQDCMIATCVIDAPETEIEVVEV